MARIDFLRQDGEWSQSPSRSFLKNRASEIFVKIYRLVVYVIETYIGSFFIYLFIYLFIFWGEGGAGRGMYTCEMIPKNTNMIISYDCFFFYTGN